MKGLSFATMPLVQENQDICLLSSIAFVENRCYQEAGEMKVSPKVT